MHILEIDISNTRKLKAFKIKIDGRNMEVAGDTGAGKTTAISALWDILKRKEDTLTHGKKKGYIQITVGDDEKTIVAKRTESKSGASGIKLSDAEGKAVSIKDFKQMVSELSVNPHKIIEMKPTEQVAALMKGAKVDIDLEQVNEDIATFEAGRLESGRLADAVNPGEEPEFTEEVDATEITGKLNLVRDKNALFTSICDDRDQKQNRLAEIKEQIKHLQAEQDNLEIELTGLNTRIEKGKKVINKLGNEQELWDELNNLQETNAKAATWFHWNERHEEYKKHVDIRTAFDRRIKDLREQKKEALDNAEWPLDGLTIEDGDILYNDVLLTSLGESEQMLVCAALAMEDIKNHPLKVVRMDGVESMSKKDFKQLQKMFNDNGIQVLSTRVARDTIDDNEIEIVEGEYEDT